jgi:phage baseplate assembly protein W
MAITTDIYYSDLNLNPIVNSQGDISTVTNKDCIRQSLKMIVDTARGSRIFLPTYGCRIRGFLFEMFDESTAKRIGEELEETLKNHEPRIEILNLNVNMNWQNTQYDITIVYRLTNTQTVDVQKFSLEKL